MDEPIPAATLILWRDGPPAELLMIERATGMAFAGGAMVFPGGRIDPADRALALALALRTEDPAEATAKIAAIRETIEETGIAVAIDPLPDPATLARWRAALLDGDSLGALLAAGGHRLALDRLTPFARWCPGHGRERRRFDTRFFLARAPAGAEPLADGGETTAAHWLAPAEVLADAAAGRRHVIFPTARNLERLAALPDFATAQADAARWPPRLIEPWIERRDDGDWLCIPEDAGYPVTGQSIAQALRG